VVHDRGLAAYGHDMGYRLYEEVPSGAAVIVLQWGESIALSDPMRPSWELVSD
jgi:hypothetical protein